MTNTPPVTIDPAVDQYLSTMDGPQRATLDTLRATIRNVVPHADECISYGLPAFALGGKAIAGYAGFAKHCSYFPMSGGVLGQAGDAVAAYEISKGALKFDIGTKLPVPLIRRLIRLRLAEISDVKNGTRIDYYDDGQIKAIGKMASGELHGAWKWFRQDGTLMREGSFRKGQKVGTWTTWERDGSQVKVTEFA